MYIYTFSNLFHVFHNAACWPNYLSCQIALQLCPATRSTVCTDHVILFVCFLSPDGLVNIKLEFTIFVAMVREDGPDTQAVFSTWVRVDIMVDVYDHSGRECQDRLGFTFIP